MFWFLIIILILILLITTYIILPTYFYKWQYILKRVAKGKKIYLTFDDGPSEYTDKLLDVLKKYHVKASFFCVAEFAQKYPQIIKRMQKEKHLIGLHSLNHHNAFLMDIFRTNYDFKKSLEIMQKLNTSIHYYRPPWGDMNLASLINIRKYKLQLVMWHVMAEDWEKDTTIKDITHKLLNRVKGNDIICLHDGRGANKAPARTIAALDKVIPILLNAGYEFELVDKYYEK